MSKTRHYRQGDVLLTLIDALPKGNQKKRDRGTVAEGEVTGHAHRVQVENGAEVFEVEGMTGAYVSVTAAGGVSIVHEEHGSVQLPQGSYRATIQREYTPAEIRNVAD